MLAGGFGRRFGSDKRRHRLSDGTPLLIASVRRYLQGFPRLIVVLRPEDNDLAQQVEQEDPARVRCVRCPESSQGMGYSLACGTRAAAGWPYLFVTLADMAWVRPDTLARLTDAMTRGGASAVVQPFFEGTPGHPVGFGAAWFPSLCALTGDEGARAVVRAAAAAGALTRVPVDDPGVLEDLDTPP